MRARKSFVVQKSKVCLKNLYVLYVHMVHNRYLVLQIYNCVNSLLEKILLYCKFFMSVCLISQNYQFLQFFYNLEILIT